MRPWSLILVLVCAGCMLRLPKPGQLGIAVKTSTRVQVRAQVQVQGQVQGPAPEVLVPLQGAPVVEFFGIPLENAQDVVFVLDCSGSMSGPAQGRMAQIQPPPADAPPPVAPPPGALPPGVPASASQPPGAPTEPPPPPPDAVPPPPGASPDQTASAPTTQPASSSVLGPTKLDVAQSELVDALRRLPPGTRMNVLFFNSDLDAYAPELIPLGEGSRAQLISFVQGTRPLGSTALAPAMRTAFLMNARRVVLLSDGLGNVGGNAAALLRDAREAMRGGVRIDTIGLGAGQDARTLATLANESGGLYQAL